jgi:SagB-type dehydrogenase family enzyme
MTTDALTVACPEALRLRPGVFLAAGRSGQDYLLHQANSQRLGALTRTQRDVLHQLAGSSCPAESLREMARDAGGDAGVAELGSLLDQLRTGGWLYIAVIGEDGPAYTIQPHRRPGPLPAGDGQAGLALSRFAVMRRCGADLLIESPRAWCSIAVHDPGVMGAVAALARPRAAASAAPGSPVPAAPGVSAAGLGSLPAPLARRLLSDLAWATLVVPAPGEEDSAFELRQWSPHELWFHMRSRAEGVPDGHFGRTQWAVGLFEPLPARRDSFSERRIELPRPDISALRLRDATLTSVLEDRRSIRRHDDEHPITLEQIGEFLYRAAGVRYTAVQDGVEVVTGPNPSGGALDAIEFYLAVRLAERLEPGLYRYDRLGHRLDHVSGTTRAVRRLIDAAQQATGGSGALARTHPPQLVVLLAARFGRVGWSYESLAYSLIVKHVGVTFQTMYCVATAMGLAPCALGAGDPAVFAEATGLDPLTEGTVGEFVLGSRPTGETSGPAPQAAE